MSSKSTLLLEHHLKKLKLPSFLREYQKMAAQCAAENVDHPEYLLHLAGLEPRLSDISCNPGRDAPSGPLVQNLASDRRLVTSRSGRLRPQCGDHGAGRESSRHGSCGPPRSLLQVRLVQQVDGDAGQAPYVLAKGAFLFSGIPSRWFPVPGAC